MAAATVNSSKANEESFFRIAKRVTAVGKNPNLKPQGIYMFDSGSDTVAVTSVDDANDEHFTLKFPKNSYLVSLTVDTSDMDGGADLLLDFIVEDSAGTETVLINASAAAQTGIVDELDTGLLLPLDVSNQKLGFKVQASGVGVVAGTVRYKGLVYMGDVIENF